MIISILLNIVIVLSTIIAIAMYFFTGPDALGATGISCLKYFTSLSNILLAISSLLLLQAISKKKKTIPNWIVSLKYIGTVAALITFVTVCIFLVPVAVLNAGPKVIPKFFAGNVFALHLSTPLLGMISFCFFEKQLPLNKKSLLLGTLPSSIYSIIYLIMVVFLKVWPDWYGFTFGGRYYMVPVVIVFMFLLSLILSKLVMKLHMH